MRNTRKNRDEIATIVSSNWGTSMHDLQMQYPEMSAPLREWCVKYLSLDKDARKQRLMGDVYSASVYEERMEKMINTGK